MHHRNCLQSCSSWSYLGKMQRMIFYESQISSERHQHGHQKSAYLCYTQFLMNRLSQVSSCGEAQKTTGTSSMEDIDSPSFSHGFETIGAIRSLLKSIWMKNLKSSISEQPER